MLDTLHQQYQRHRLVLLVIFLTGLSAYMLNQFLWATEPRGMGLRTDSVRYLWSAENLAKGLGLGRENGDKQFSATTHWPPLYPVLLAGLDAAGLDIDQSARWLGAFSLVGVIAAAGLFFYRLTNGSPAIAALGAGLLMTMPHFWDTGLYAMTEALYMLWVLLALLFLDLYFEKERPGWLVASALAQAAGFLTRYVGGALLAACALGLLLIPAWAWRRKIFDTFKMGAIAIAPMVLWFVRNLAYTGAATNRTLELHPITAEEWSAFGAAIRDWFNPLDDLGTITAARLLTIAVMAVAAAWFLHRRPTPQPGSHSRLWLLTLIATPIYAALTVAARLLFDPYIPLGEQRILLPFFIGMFALLIYGLYRLQVGLVRFGAAARVFAAAVLIVGAWVFGRGYFKETLLLWDYTRYPGLGVANVVYDRLGFIPSVAAYPAEATYFTDNLDLMYHVFHRPAFQVNMADPGSVAQISTRAGQGSVVLVLFQRDPAQPAPDIPGVQIVYEAPDGVVYNNFR